MKNNNARVDWMSYLEKCSNAVKVIIMNLCSKAMRIHSRLRNINSNNKNANETKWQNKEVCEINHGTITLSKPGTNVLSRSEQATKVNLNEIYCDEVMAVA